MTPALSVRQLCKHFPKFSLQDITFDVPQGSVVGLIGENGSGKSTTLECILGQDIPDTGEISVYGINPFQDIQAHARIGAAFDTCLFPEVFTPATLEKAFAGIWPGWDRTRWKQLMETCGIPEDQKIQKFSRGMKAKLSLAAALSHDASLLILDEATAGLDPVVREEMLDLLLDFMQDETHSILMTSHITSDLERIADYIVFIQDGRIVFTEEKETLLNAYGMAQVTRDQLEFIDGDLVLRKRTQPLATDLLVADRKQFARRYPDYAVVPATLDEIVLMFTKGETL
ncbi:ABC transporter ATP-binding protein [uncultured Faecalibaculum sp.]|uniref:ABC transporter ATP-binding protein n=1 Tax=uncultured Faecalibaculum sp. TaxID=1729681 RepID=UPI00261A1C16|nr:ABC transporter ATP-binding protein [uncultured Faecalibaculum sp.]